MEIIKKHKLNKTDLLKKYEKLKKTLIEIYNENGCGPQNPEDFFNPDISKLACDELEKEIISLKTLLAEIIKIDYIPSWTKLINENYGDKEKDVILQMLNNLSKYEPVNFFETFSRSCCILKQLTSDQSKELALKFLEEYSKSHNIESVSNNFELLFYSNYQQEIKNAILNGFQKNSKVNFKHALAYLGGNCVPSQKEA